MARRPGRTARLSLRLAPEAKERIPAAARAAQSSTNEFVLQCALSRAGETLADRTRFALDAERWKAFLEALDAPPRNLPRLERLFREPSPFESSKDRE